MISLLEVTVANVVSLAHALLKTEFHCKLRENNCTVPGFMTLPLRALHFQGISPALQDPLGTSSPWEIFDLPAYFHLYSNGIAYPEPRGSPSDKQPLWAQVHTTHSWEILLPTSTTMNLSPVSGGLWLSKSPCHQLQSNLVWAHNLQQTQRSVTSCSCTETYTPICQKVEIYLLLVPELLIPGAAVTFGNHISQ